MKQLLSLVNYYNSLKKREQFALIIGMIITFAYVLYIGIYSPLTELLHKNQGLLTEKTTTLTFMQTAKKRLSKSSSEPQLNLNQLLTNISNSLKTSDLAPYPHVLQQKEDHEISLHFDKAPYTIFNRWLWELEDNNQILSIKRITLKKTQEQGMVTIDVLLKAEYPS